jgi:hypothetical protein
MQAGIEADIEKDFLALERKFWQAMKDRDIETALSLTADPCIVAGPQGVMQVDKPTFEKMMRTGAWTLNEFDIRDVKVQQLSENVVVIGYKVHEKITVDDQPLTIEAADASTWVHTESLAGDPYGRDKIASS